MESTYMEAVSLHNREILRELAKETISKYCKP